MSWACLLRSSIKILCSSLCLSRSLIQLLSFSAMSLMLHQLAPGTRSTTCPYDSPTILGTLLPESHHHDQSAHHLPADKCDMQLHVVLNQQLGHRQRFGQRSSNLLQLVAPNRDVPQLVSRSIHGDRLAVNSRGSSRGQFTGIVARTHAGPPRISSRDSRRFADLDPNRLCPSAPH